MRDVRFVFIPATVLTWQRRDKTCSVNPRRLWIWRVELVEWYVYTLSETVVFPWGDGQ